MGEGEGTVKTMWFQEKVELTSTRKLVPDEPFPMAKMKEMSTTKVGEDEYGREELSSPFPKALQGSKSRLEEEYEKVGRREWVHDRYQPESPTRGSHRVKMERDSYRPVQEIDSYRPKALEENRPVARSGMELGRFLRVSLCSADNSSFQVPRNQVCYHLKAMVGGWL